MEIIVDDVYTTLSGFLPKDVIQSITSYKVENPWFYPAYQKGHWDGRKSFSKKKGDSLLVPTGFLSRVMTKLEEINWAYTLEDRRELIAPDSIYELNDYKFGTIKLNEGKYAYQGEVLDKALQLGRGIIKIGTGGGKTEIGGAIFNSLLSTVKESKRRGCIWLTHRGALAEQTRDRLRERLQRPITLFGYGSWQVEDITVLMVQSARDYGTAEAKTLTKLIDNCGCVIGDEIHHLESDEWYTLWQRIKAPYRFGLTATPKLKGRGLALLAMTEDIIADIPANELIDRFVLVPPRIWLIKLTEPALDKKLKWQQRYKQGIVFNELRNGWIRIASKQFKEDGKPILTLVSQLQHGELLADSLCQAGVRTEFLSGKDKTDIRKRELGKLKEGELDCIVGQVQCFGEGVDLPFVKAIINATGKSGGGDASADGEEGRLTKQILGRGLRRYPGKFYVDYLDFLDYFGGFKSDSLDRLNTLKAEGYEEYMQLWSSYVS